MATTFPPKREADLVTWSANFSAKITLSPTTYGLVAGQATALATLTSAFASKYAIAQAEATRSPMNITLEDAAKTALVANIRQLAGVANRFPAMTNALRQDLGLPPYDSEPTPKPVPGFAPGVSVKKVLGRTVTYRLQDTENPDSRGKPAAVASASVMTWVGENPPEDITKWTWQGLVTRTTFNIEFPLSVEPFAQVWVTAMWANPRGQTGPASTPISTNLGSWLVQMAA